MSFVKVGGLSEVPVGKMKMFKRVRSKDSLKSCKRVKPKVVRVPFEMTNVFQMKLDSIQPSQLYINSEKLRYVMRQLQSEPVFVKPIPVKKLGNQVVLVDGHTRAFAAFLLGFSEIPVQWERARSMKS